MSGFDANHIYNVAVHEPPVPTSPDSPSETEKLLLDFLLQYRIGGEFMYRRVFQLQYFHSESDLPSRDKLRANLLLKQHQLEVDLRHVGLFNDELAHAIQDRPADVLPLVRTLGSVHQISIKIEFSSKTLLLRLPGQFCSLWLVALMIVTQKDEKQRKRSLKFKSPSDLVSICYNFEV
jgi:hypothetical protein